MHKTVNNQIYSWLQKQQAVMVDAVTNWAEINSYTYNKKGMDLIAETVLEAFASLGGTVTRHKPPPFEQYNSEGIKEKKAIGPCLQIEKYPDAKTRVLLLIHMDTVYPPDTTQQKNLT